METKNTIDLLNEVYQDAPSLLSNCENGDIYLTYDILLWLLTKDYKSIDIKVRRKVNVTYSESNTNEIKVRNVLIKFLS